jgi:hypothetical protein
VTPVVLDASAGVELLLHSAVGRRVGAAIDGSTIWVMRQLSNQTLVRAAPDG